jgi:hypothetical protein
MEHVWTPGPASRSSEADDESQSAGEVANTATTQILGPTLAPGTYVCRARMSEIVNNYLTNPPLVSPWTETRTLVVPAVIDASKVVGPTAGSSVHDRPTLVVTNPARSGPVGPLEYRFEVALASTFTPETIVTGGTVAEGAAGQTSWTVPADLVPGLHYYWRATVLDSNSRIASPFIPSADFWAVAAAERLYFLDIHINPACTPMWAYDLTYYASSPDPIGAASFTLKTLTTLGLTLSGGPHASGTISGSAPHRFGEGGGTLKIADGTAAVSTTATIGSDGAMTGLFDGPISMSDYYGVYTCSKGGNSWVVRMRTE